MNEGDVMRRLGRDDGISSILGFIVAMVMLVASTAGVAYFIASQPDPQQDETSQDLQSSATRAAQQLVTTPGQPTDWHTSPGDLERAGLLKDASTGVIDLKKVQALRDGTIDNGALLDALDLRTRGYSIHAKGEVHSNALIRPPSQDGFSIVAGDDLDDGNIADQSELDTGSWGDLQKVCEFNTKCANTVHNWEFDWTRHPSQGLGDVFPDHPWWIETQLVPQLAGLRATYVQGPTLNSSIPDSGDDSAQDTVFDKFDSGDVQVSRWRVLQENEDTCLPDGDSRTGQHALIFGRIGNPQGKCSEGTPHREVLEGYRGWTLLGPYQAGSADNLWLNFSQVLQVSNDEEDEDGGEDDECEDVACFAPRILFWNATKEGGTWDRIRPEHKPSNGGCSSGWDDKSPATGTKWTIKEINLCQALQDGLGEVWLAFFWDSWCENDQGAEIACSGSAAQDNIWAIDDITVEGTVEASTHTFDSLDIEPDPDTDPLLTLSSGVDHNLHEAASEVYETNPPLRVPPITWMHSVVMNGTNILSLEPGDTGGWLGGVGLEAVSASGAPDGEEFLDDHLFSRVPYDLHDGEVCPSDPALGLRADGDGYATSEDAWSVGTTGRPTKDSTPPDAQLDAVHAARSGSDCIEGYGTVMMGRPFTGGGTVAAIAYNLSTLQSDDPDLYDEFMINLLASMVFQDPTFELQGSEVPQSVGSPVATARRVALVTVDDQERYTLPMEITVYLWEQCVDGDLSTDACDPP